MVSLFQKAKRLVSTVEFQELCLLKKTNDDNLEANEQEYKININETLVQEGYATEYWGGKKKK